MQHHPELREFSDRHHQGLVHAHRLRKAAWGGESLTGAADAFLAFWREENSVHLREEEVLLPVMVRNGVGQGPVTQMLAQHAQLRGLATEVGYQAVRKDINPGTLRDLGEMLETHVRMEEHELFPLVEEILPKNAFEEVSSRLKVFEISSTSGTPDAGSLHDSWPDVEDAEKEEPEAPLVKLPGSEGEHELQKRFDTDKQAYAFYDKQMLGHLNPLMREFIAQQEMLFIGTADSNGECDCSFRSGLPGFARVLDEKTLIYPELKGNGVMASLGNISENPHIGVIFIDFFESTVGLHVNGKASIAENDELLERPDLPEEIRENVEREDDGSIAQRWVVIEVEEAYIQCAKHVPLLKKLDKELHWGTDDEAHKGGDYFEAKASPRPWSEDSSK